MQEELEQDFDNGVIKGIDNVGIEHHEEVINHTVDYDWSIDRYRENNLRLQEIESKTVQVKQSKMDIFGRFKTEEKEVLQRRSQLEHLNETRSRYLDEISDKEAVMKSRHSPYSLLAGVLYFFAGIAFIVGDLIISHEIVAYALNIRDNTEAWAFAIGLASLSILLKPAYERLIEQPYLDGKEEKAKKIYGYFQTFLLVACFGTMTILGWFRYEAYKTDKLKEGINREIKSLQLESSPIDPAQQVNETAIIQKIEGKLQEYNELNISLVNSPVAMLSFVLSGVLFALAGAICLGIAFPIITFYWVRGLQHRPFVNRRRRRIRKLDREVKVLKTELYDFESKTDVLQHEIDHLPELEILKNEGINLQNENNIILEELRKSRQSSRINTFKDGYSKGKISRSEMTDEEYEEYRKRNLERVASSGISQKSDSNSRTYRKDGLRPHLALRKVIAERYGEN